MDDNHEIHETHEIDLIWFLLQAGLAFIRVFSVAEVFRLLGNKFVIHARNNYLHLSSSA